MTDNKKTIDGVDVSECCNYDDTQFWECEPSYCHCEELPNCNYKQLKRAEQKLDKIKDVVTDIDGIIQNYETSYDLSVDILQIIEDKENE